MERFSGEVCQGVDQALRGKRNQWVCISIASLFRYCRKSVELLPWKSLPTKQPLPPGAQRGPGKGKGTLALVHLKWCKSPKFCAWHLCRMEPSATCVGPYRMKGQVPDPVMCSPACVQPSQPTLLAARGRQMLIMGKSSSKNANIAIAEEH